MVFGMYLLPPKCLCSRKADKTITTPINLKTSCMKPSARKFGTLIFFFHVFVDETMVS